MAGMTRQFIGAITIWGILLSAAGQNPVPARQPWTAKSRLHAEDQVAAKLDAMRAAAGCASYGVFMGEELTVFESNLFW